MSFSRDLPDPGIEPRLTSPALAGGFFSTSATWEVLTVLLAHTFIRQIIYFPFLKFLYD